MNRDDTGRLISEKGITPRKNRGQNFLIDDRVAQRHIDYACIEKGDRVLEVGPGLGILTKELVKVSDDVICIEIDPALADYVRNTFGDSVNLIEEDALKIEFPPFDRFVSNLPYSVSTPIIFKLLNYNFKKAVVMVQKEFADRMVADAGSPDYSRLTVNLFFRAECKILENVPSSRFEPRPKVDSALVSIEPRPAPFDVIDAKTFKRVVDVAFTHRRKKIGTSLRSAGMIEKDDPLPFRDERIEHLVPSEIAEVADAVYTLKNTSTDINI